MEPRSRGLNVRAIDFELFIFFACRRRQPLYPLHSMVHPPIYFFSSPVRISLTRMMFDEDDRVEYNTYHDKYPGVILGIFLVVVTGIDIRGKGACSVSCCLS